MRRLGEGFEDDFVAEVLELAHETLLVGLGGLALDEVVGAQIGVGLAAFEQVVRDHRTSRTSACGAGSTPPAAGDQPATSSRSTATRQIDDLLGCRRTGTLTCLRRARIASISSSVRGES